jgi:hypothetical protein
MQMAGNEAAKIIRREESLRSVEEKGTQMRLLFENDWLEIVTTEMEPQNSLGSNELPGFAAVHLVAQGGILFHSSDRSVFLLPGDGISLREGEEYTISNPTCSCSVIWTLLFKKSGQEGDGGGL